MKNVKVNKIVLLSFMLMSVLSMKAMANIPRCPYIIACQSSSHCTIIDKSPGTLDGWSVSGTQGVLTFADRVRFASINGLVGVSCFYNNNKGSVSELYAAPSPYNPEQVAKNNSHFRKTTYGYECMGDSELCAFTKD